MIIIPINWLFHWEYTLFSDKPKWSIWKLRNPFMAIQAISGGHVLLPEKIPLPGDILAEQKNHFQNLGVFLLNIHIYILYIYSIYIYYIYIYMYIYIYISYIYIYINILYQYSISVSSKYFARGFVEFEFHMNCTLVTGRCQQVLGSPFGLSGQRECGHLSQSKQDQRPGGRGKLQIPLAVMSLR